MQPSQQQPYSVSAVITAYNCAAFVSEAIESVLAQTHRPDEIVVVDDGSTDGTAAVVARYADRGVRYVYQENRGAGAARNQGIAETSGALIVFLDGDDIWLPEKTERQLAYMRANPTVAMVSCHRYRWNVMFNRRTLEPFGTVSGRRLQRENLINNVVGNPSQAMIRREVFDEVGRFDSSLRWGQDWELWIRVAVRYTIGFIPEPLMIYRWHMGGLTNTNRGWERRNVVYGISQRAITRYAPWWDQPLLRLRAWSLNEHFRAVHAVRYRMPRGQQVKYAGYALLAYPFEKPLAKAKLLLRTLVGEGVYSRVRKPRLVS